MWGSFDVEGDGAAEGLLKYFSKLAVTQMLKARWPKRSGPV
jgi:hypothetical protein